MQAILISKVEELLSEQQFAVLKMFLNGESYTNIAKTFNLTCKNVDNMLQAIKKKLRSLSDIAN